MQEPEVETSLERTSLEGILGEPSPDVDWKAAIVLQGPYVREHAPNTVRIFLERNPPDVLVIVATYIADEKERTGDELLGSFLSDFEKSILFDDPHHMYAGRLVYTFVRIPSKQDEPDFWRTNIANQNMQRLSSFVGLRYAKELGIKWSLKCRLDAFLGMSNVCAYFQAQCEVFPVLSDFDTNQVIEYRIITGDYSLIYSDTPKFFNASADYFIADFWLFSTTRNLIQYFNIDKSSHWDNGRGIRTNHVESNLAEVWMSDMHIPLQSDTVIGLAAKYFIIQDSTIVEFVWQKRLSYQAFMQNSNECLAKMKTAVWGPKVKLFDTVRWFQFFFERFMKQRQHIQQTTGVQALH